VRKNNTQKIDQTKDQNQTEAIAVLNSDARTVRRVLTVSAFLFCISSVFFIGLKRTDWFPWVGECYPNAKAGHFLAYCHTIRYGDYEHYAYYHESEPEAVAQAQLADVIFLGSSNTQFAFSTEAVSDFFNEQSVSHYVLGFGHGAQSGVAKAIAKKLRLQPKLWVVNADPFFTGEANATFERIFQPDSESFLPRWLQTNVHGEHARKRWLQAQQSERCGQGEEGVWCQGGADTLHRNASNGHWSVENYRENLERPVGQDTTGYVENVAEYTGIAKEFIEELGIDASCLIITATPRADTPEAYAQQLANNLSASFVAPKLDDLKTIDGFHLDPVSAQNWSKAFLEEISPHITRCLSSSAKSYAQGE